MKKVRKPNSKKVVEKNLSKQIKEAKWYIMWVHTRIRIILEIGKKSKTSENDPWSEWGMIEVALNIVLSHKTANIIGVN